MYSARYRQRGINALGLALLFGSVAGATDASSQVVREDLHELVVAREVVALHEGRGSVGSRAEGPFMIEHRGDIGGQQTLLLRFQLDGLQQTRSVNAMLQVKGRTFGAGNAAAVEVFTVENEWDPHTVCIATTPRIIRRVGERTLKSNYSGTLTFPLGQNLRWGPESKELSLLIRMRSKAGFSQAIEFSQAPRLSIAKTEQYVFDLPRLLSPIWKDSLVENETLLPTSLNGEAAEAKLAFMPAEILRVQNYALDRSYELGRDYVVDGRTIRLVPGSSIPSLRYDELYHNDPTTKPGTMRTIDGSYLTFSESPYFNDRQLAVTYRSKDPWGGPVPTSTEDKLLKTFARLKAGQPLKIVVFGDSITAGAGASGPCARKPYMPGWPELVAYGLRQAYNSEIECINASLGGTTSAWGREVVDGLAAGERPDLVIIGFGMNDNGRLSAIDYAANIRATMASFSRRNSSVEFVLLTSIQPNHKWRRLKPMERYWEALRRLEGPGVVVADVWSIHDFLLESKSYWDMTGNHVNHPNDFLVRIYAQTVLASLDIK